MPPASRNHLEPTGWDAPTSTAAPSLDRPAAINAQNRRRSSRRATPGRPGERITTLPNRSVSRFRLATTTSLIEVLRRPVEFALSAVVWRLSPEALLRGLSRVRRSRRGSRRDFSIRPIVRAMPLGGQILRSLTRANDGAAGRRILHGRLRRSVATTPSTALGERRGTWRSIDAFLKRPHGVVARPLTDDCLACRAFRQVHGAGIATPALRMLRAVRTAPAAHGILAIVARAAGASAELETRNNPLI